MDVLVLVMTRFDICEAYYLYATHYHRSGLTERCVMHVTPIWEQLERMRFRPSPMLSEETLSEEGLEVYHSLIRKWEGVDPDA